MGLITLDGHTIDTDCVSRITGIYSSSGMWKFKVILIDNEDDTTLKFKYPNRDKLKLKKLKKLRKKLVREIEVAQCPKQDEIKEQITLLQEQVAELQEALYYASLQGFSGPGYLEAKEDWNLLQEQQSQ